MQKRENKDRNNNMEVKEEGETVKKKVAHKEKVFL